MVAFESPNWKSPLGESVQACNLNLRISFAIFRYSLCSILPNNAHFSLKMSLSNRVQVFLYLLRGIIRAPSGQLLLQGVNGTEQLQPSLAPPHKGISSLRFLMVRLVARWQLYGMVVLSPSISADRVYNRKKDMHMIDQYICTGIWC